jgi:hypothetical protein
VECLEETIPVATYADFIKVNVPYVWCEPKWQNNSWFLIAKFATMHLLSKGEVTPNACGKSISAPVPGELTIYVRPLSFWEKLKQ